ncbi:RNA polymerase subunit sigma-70 [Pedobacter sp. Leaf216]|nr:RNA polymerase subunit sigma-70 [Pedobacter sp. Leaf216]
MAESNKTFLTVEMREAFFIALYKKAFSSVARYVAKMGGTLDEAQDIFQDTLVIYYEKIISANAETIVNEQAYLLGIAKKLWLQHYKKSMLSQPLNDFDIQADTDVQHASHKILHYLETAGRRCMDLLQAFYFDNLPVAKLAGRFGYSGVHSATVAKYKCLEKVRESVKQNLLNYADFIE